MVASWIRAPNSMPVECGLAQFGGGLLADSGLQHFLGAAPLGELLMGRVERHHLERVAANSPRLVRIRTSSASNVRTSSKVMAQIVPTGLPPTKKGMSKHSVSEGNTSSR